MSRTNPLDEVSNDRRPLIVFMMPEAVAAIAFNGQQPITSIALVELTTGEYKMVLDRCADDNNRVPSERLKQALRLVNCDVKGNGGEPMSIVDASADRVVDKRMHPKVLTLALSAVAELHDVDKKDAEAFLAGRRVVAVATSSG